MSAERDGHGREAELGALLDEAEALARRDGAFDVEAFAEAHPSFADEILELVPLLLGLRRPGDSIEDERARRGQFGPFEIERTLGYGGMGTVYLARDERLSRHVALKRLRTGSSTDERFLERFQREARATARLSHPNIVQLLDAGEIDGTPYYTMRYVEGVTLEDWLAAAERSGERRRRRSGESSVAEHPEASSERSPAELGFVEVADLVRALAEAVAHAHEQGILHRDIKPGNVMLDRRGRPLILDFGICRLEGDADLTGTEFVGTLRYAAPEQLKGTSDERSDVYALGLILYEILTLRRVWRGRETSELVLAVRSEELKRPRRVDRQIPSDLETVARKAYAKLPEERYASAAALARDLEAFALGRPIAARPPSALYLMRLFAGRHRSLCATALLSLCAIGLLTTLYVLDVRDETRRRLSEAYSARVAAAQAALALGETSSAIHHLERAPRELTDWCWRNLRARADQALVTLDPWPDSNRYINELRTSPDGRSVAVAGRPGTVVLDVASRTLTHRFEGTDIDRVAWRPDGGALATLARERVLTVHTLGSEDDAVEHRFAATVTALAWTKLGLVAGDEAGSVWIWQPGEGSAQPASLAPLPGAVRWLYGGDLGHGLGTAHVFAATERGRLLRSCESGEWDEVSELGIGSTATSVLGVDPVNGRIIVGDGSATVRTVDPVTGQTVTTFESALQGQPLRSAVAGDGVLAVASLRRRQVTLLDARTGGLLGLANGHSSAARALAAAPVTGEFVTGDVHGFVRIWDATLLGGRTALRAHENDVWALDLAPDGRLLATGGRDGIVAVWDLATAELWRFFPDPGAPVDDLKFDRTGRILYAVCRDGSLYALDVYAGEVHERVPLDVGPAFGLHRVGASGDLFVVGHKGQVLVERDVGGAAVVRTLSADGAYSCAPAGDEDAAVILRSGEVARVRARTGERLWTTELRPSASALATDPLNGLAAVIVDGERVQILDLDSGASMSSYRLPSTSSGEDTLIQAAFGPEPGHVSASSTDGSLFVWRIGEPTEPVHTIPVHTQYPTALLADPEHDRLITGSSDRTVQVWGTRSTAELADARNVCSALGDPAVAEAHRQACTWDAKLGLILAGIEAREGDLFNSARTLLVSLERMETRHGTVDPRLEALRALYDLQRGGGTTGPAEVAAILGELGGESPYAAALRRAAR